VRRSVTLVALFALLLGALQIVALPQSRPEQSSLQTQRGARVFSERCAACHGVNLEGLVGPRLAGAGSTLKHKAVGDIFSFISKNMPYGAPGSLTHDEYAAVMAFILKKNGRGSGNHTMSYGYLMTARTSI